MKQFILLSLLLLSIVSCSEDNTVCEQSYPMDNNIMYRRANDPSITAPRIWFSKSTFMYTAVGVGFSCAYTYKHPIITLRYNKDEKIIEWPIIVGENTLTLKDKEGNTVVYIVDDLYPQPTDE